MKIRRALATAVALAITTPAVLLAATPAFAETGSGTVSTSASTSSQTEKKPSIAELEKAVAEAKKAYEDAVAAEAAAREALEEALAETAPLAVAAAEAKKVAEEAAAAKTAADKALADAQAVVDALDENATDDERVAALKAVAEAQTAADAADAAKTAADTEYADALKARDDARVKAAQQYSVAQKAEEDAHAALEAAEKALADAKKDAGTDKPCVAEPELTVSVSGLPGKIAAGSTVDFSMRLTNNTPQTLDEVYPYAAVYATDKKGEQDLDHLLKLQWSTAASPTWKNFDQDGYAGAISPLKAGAHSDIKLRLAVDAKAPAGEGVALTAGDYLNDDGSCGGTPYFNVYEFDVVAAGTKPGKGGGATPGTTPRPADDKPQGGTSTVPVSTPTGTLAQTGSSSAVPQLALAGGIAVALGAGAMVVARRRAAGSGA